MNVGFNDLLALVLITLKLCGILKWSWFWVLTPFWIPFAIVGVSVIFVALKSVLK